MVDERLHDLARPAQVERRADEHVLGPFADEGVDQLLRGGAVDLVGPAGAAQPASRRG